MCLFFFIKKLGSLTNQLKTPFSPTMKMIQKCFPHMTLKNYSRMMMIVYFFYLNLYLYLFKVDVKHPRNQSKTWYKIEDQTLIQNYDQFKDLPNSEDHLL